MVTDLLEFRGDSGALIEALRNLPQVEMPLTHRFQDGVYLREIFMPADTWVVGHVHKTRHWNVILSGSAIVSVGGVARKISAGMVFESPAGSQKWLYIVEDMRFMTIHGNPSDESDIPTIEEGLIEMPEEMMQAKGRMSVDAFRLSVNQLLKG